MAIQGWQCRWLYWADSADGYTGQCRWLYRAGSADGYTGLTVQMAIQGWQCRGQTSLIHLQEELYVSGLHELRGGGGGEGE